MQHYRSQISEKQAQVTESLFNFDAKFQASSRLLIGVDEVGRGSLIGPVTAGAVSFTDKETTQLTEVLVGLNDSKRLNAAKRQALCPLITANSLWGLGWASQAEVETLNVAQACQLAVHRALEVLLAKADTRAKQPYVLLDGNSSLKDWPLNQQTAIVKGDGLSASIAAASILAKEARDAWVLEQNTEYPQYGWQQNMGYATKAHRDALQQHGRSPLHRNTFKT